MAKKVTGPTKDDKNNVSQPKNGAVKKTAKRNVTSALDLPSIAIPGGIVAGIILLCYILATYDTALFKTDLDHILMLVAGGCTVLFFVAAPIYRNGKQLTKPFAKTIVGVLGLLTLLICGYALYTGANFGEPIAEGVILAGENDAKMISFNSPGTHYRIFLRGSFPAYDPEKEAAAEKAEQEAQKQQQTTDGKKQATPAKKKQGSFKVSGTYAIQVRAADGRTAITDYSGAFEQMHTRRKVSKKARGYVDVLKTSVLKPLNLPQPGEYQLHVLSLGSELDQQVEYAIYRDMQYPMLVALIGLLAAFVMGLIDHLIKPLRVESYFAVLTGMAFGFASYFNMDAGPISPFGTMAIDLLVGCVMGGGIAYVIYSVAGKAYSAIARRMKWSLN